MFTIWLFEYKTFVRKFSTETQTFSLLYYLLFARNISPLTKKLTIRFNYKTKQLFQLGVAYSYSLCLNVYSFETFYVKLEGWIVTSVIQKYKFWGFSLFHSYLTYSQWPFTPNHPTLQNIKKVGYTKQTSWLNFPTFLVGNLTQNFSPLIILSYLNIP